MKRTACVLACLALVAACGGRVGEPRAQLLVTVHTDAPVPHLGDRVLVEVLDENGAPACTGCRRIFGLRSPDEWPFSFGVPEGTSARRLRVRLYRVDHSDAGGGPTGDLTLDDVSILPATDGAVRAVDIVLPLACAGVAADPALGTTCDPATGKLAARVASPLAGVPPRAGSAEEGRSVPCAGPAPAGMVCVPGELFARGSSLAVSIDLPMRPERLVRVSPFAIDAYEMSVGEMRTLVASGSVPAPVVEGPNLTATCTYTDVPRGREDLPVNCVPFDVAAAACKARGLRLPTEAEWELAAGNGTRETRYPWGDDADICAYAVIGRARLTPVEVAEPVEPSLACRITLGGGDAVPWGPRPVGESADVTDSGIHDLAGNVTEWVADTYEDYGGTCSAGPRVLVNPRCQAGDLHVHRGGDWGDMPISAEIVRRQRGSGLHYPWAGFRCAVSL